MQLAGIRQVDVMVGHLVSSFNLSWIVSFSAGVEVFIPPHNLQAIAKIVS
jgi:hypothetical protein